MKKIWFSGNMIHKNPPVLFQGCIFMRWYFFCLILLLSASLPGYAAVPLTTPVTASQVNSAPATQPAAGISVPYKLTASNHILIRVKINGKGPFNFIMDTGAPAMFLRVPAAEKLGLKTNSGGLTTIDKLEVEGGVSLKHVQCVVETPYQIEGMNAMGASGVDLDGLMGYSVLARFRLQIDLSKDHMLWTPVNFNPPPLNAGRAPRNERPQTDETDKKEANLESMGGLMKVLGPLVKPKDYPSKYRGFVGIELAESDGKVSVTKVLGGSPADKAGIEPGDVLESVNDHNVHTTLAAQNAMAKTFAGQVANLVLHRADATMKLSLTCTEGM
jgi:predicted aspartyl protease